ncbi:type IV secretion system protein [Acinetobacter baumannii]|nr:type IV secretion system protein [Acinetobacter baumannii]MDV7408371.1 type IV secretion system protein [Acinetobacter baumannii]
MQQYLKLNNEAYESFMDLVKQILQQANSYGSRSSILSVLLWVIFGLIAPFIISSIFAPIWVSILLAVLLVLFLLLLAFVFLYCLLKGRTDELRSEKFVISKLAIENQIPEDSLNGQMKFIDSSTTKTITTSVDSGETFQDEA